LGITLEVVEADKCRARCTSAGIMYEDCRMLKLPEKNYPDKNYYFFLYAFKSN
jgi:hypothetical protein